MSTSLMYHAFDTGTYDYFKTEYSNRAILFHLKKKTQHQRCVKCKSRNVSLEGKSTPYKLHTLPLGMKRIFLVLHLHVLNCKNCGACKQESRDISEPRKSYTKKFARYVLCLAKQMTMLAVARHLEIGWDLVKAIIKTNLEKRAKKRSWRWVRCIAIDEIAIRKGHNYMTVVLDLDRGEVLFTAEGRDHTCLKPFFIRLRRAQANLKAIAIDMGNAYLKAVKEYWPKKVAIVYDHYHVVSNMNDIVDKVRRNEIKRLEGAGQNVLVGSRYLLLRSKEKIAEMPEKQKRLDELLAINENLHKVYLLKEDLRLFWDQDNKDEALKFILNWVQEAKKMNLLTVTRFAKSILKKIKNIISWYDYRISTGPLEGLNNKIKVLKRAAYGYRDAEFFGLRIQFIHEAKTKLIGV